MTDRRVAAIGIAIVIIISATGLLAYGSTSSSIPTQYYLSNVLSSSPCTHKCALLTSTVGGKSPGDSATYSTAVAFLPSVGSAYYRVVPTITSSQYGQAPSTSLPDGAAWITDFSGANIAAGDWKESLQFKDNSSSGGVAYLWMTFWRCSSANQTYGPPCRSFGKYWDNDTNILAFTSLKSFNQTFTFSAQTEINYLEIEMWFHLVSAPSLPSQITLTTTSAASYIKTPQITTTTNTRPPPTTSGTVSTGTVVSTGSNTTVTQQTNSTETGNSTSALGSGGWTVGTYYISYVTFILMGAIVVAMVVVIIAVFTKRHS